MLKAPKEILDSIESMQLPSIPQTLLHFLHLTEDEDTSMSELAALVGQDPALSARILTVANSVALRRGKPTISLVQCMVNLGIKLSRTLATCLVVQKVFAPASASRQYDYSGFWGHSLRVAEVCRAIAKETKYSDEEEAYLTGLLHDVGQLLLVGGVGTRYGHLLASSRDESMLRSLEEQRLGTDHAVIGSWMVNQWELSTSFMADAILFHHATASEIVTADTLSQIAWSAHLICHHHKLYHSSIAASPPPDFSTIETLLGITFARASELYQHCSQRVEFIAEALGVPWADETKTMPVSTTPLEGKSPELVETDSSRSQMAEKVRDMALFQPFLQNLTSITSESELLIAVQESARILFGLRTIAFLLVQPGTTVLSGASVNFQPALLQRIEIPIDSSYSLASRAVLEKKSYCSTFDEEHPTVVSLADIQIARALQTEGILYVPLSGRKQTIGVIVCGVNTTQARRLQKRLKWMINFAHAAAISIETWREIQEQTNLRAANLVNHFEQHTRNIVHEAANPLGIIKNYLSIMSKKLPEDTKVLQEIDILKEEMDRVTEILRQMSNLTEVLPTDEALQVNVVIESMLALYGESLFSNQGITVQLDLDPHLTPIICDRDSLKQIFFNLLNNAADALQNNGVVSISTHDGINQNGRSYIEIKLTDTGPGIPDDVMSKIFKPLDPHRRDGHSGLGLSIVAGLVEQLDGRVTCSSKTGRGTSFSILLPKSRRPIDI